MKLNLRNLALATAVAVAGSASAQTLTQEWVHTSDVQANGSARFCTGWNGDVIIPDKAARTIVKWNADGQTTIYDLNQFYTDNNLTVTAADGTTSLQAGGVAITTDDAGNILTNVNFPNGSSGTDWIIIPADGSEMKLVQLTMPEGVTAARVDNVGRVIGDVLSDEGGYIYLGPNGSTAFAVIKIVNGAQDESATWASVTTPIAGGTSTVAVPALNSVSEIDGAVDPSATFYLRNRSTATIYGWSEDGTEMVALAATNNSGGAEDFDVFTLGETQYLVQTTKSEAGGARSYSLEVVNIATGEVVAKFNNETAATQWTSYCARPIDETSAYIYQFCAGGQVALYKFSTASVEPEPESYKFGYVKNVTSGEKYLLAASDSIIATALAETYSYGYLSCDTLTNEEGYLTTLDTVNAFTITAVDSGYTIQDSYGRYLYQSGTYNSFNVAAELPAEGGVWTIEAQEDGTVKITNVAMSKWIQYSTNYTSWGSYSTESGLMPALFQLGATAEEKPVVTAKTEVANIAEFIENADLANAVTITGTVTVVAQSGSYLFLQDESGRMVAYSSSLPAYNNGDQLTGIKGTWKPYNGLPQMNPDVTTFGTATAGTPVEPTEMTLEEVAIDNLLAYIKVVGVTIPESDSYSYTINDGTMDMTMYNSLKITVPTGSDLTVEGFISCYNTSVQIMPLNITSSTGLEVVQAPEISPASGAITATQDITITCATEGASIYFTVDGTEPSETNGTLYSTPFILGKEATVKAIAVKEGMANSAVVEATYTLLSETTKQATFDFTAPSSLNPAQEEPAFGQSLAVVVNDVVFTAGANNEISLSFAKNTTTTDCRIWAGKSAYDLRTYSTSTFTIAGANAKILGIEFTGSKASADTYLTADGGSFADKIWSGEATSVTFTTVKTTNINTITVTYESDGSGIENVEVEENAPAVYYNLQGVQVANPEAGIYIKVQGGKATKVLVK